MPEEDQSSNLGIGKPVWHGKPAVGSYIIVYGVFALIAITILVTLEYELSLSSGITGSIFPASVRLGGAVVPYPVEIATTVIIAIIFVVKVIQLAILWATNKYNLLSDGLYVSRGIVNLENSFLSPFAFSDARLIRTWSMRLLKRGLIIVDANDGRHFYLKYIKDPLQVQTLIRRTMAHPSVRTE